MSLSNDKRYAEKCLLRGGPFTRRYDNCFEGGHGDEVVRYLINRSQVSEVLKAAIKKQNTWEYWSYFVEHGTYQGFKREAE